MEDLISIIIPVYNTEQYLNECVDSILAQTYENWELFLVDDGSTDKSGEICDDYAKNDTRIKVLHLENGRQGRARNRALDKAQGEYICFADSDDYLPLNALEIMWEGIKKENVKLIQFASEKILGEKRIFNFSHREYIKMDAQSALVNYITANKEVIQHAPWAKLYKAELFEGVRFPESKIYEDSATIYKLIEKCDNVVYSPQVVYYVRERDGSTTRQKIGKRNLDRLSVYEDMQTYFQIHTPNEELCRCAIAAQVDIVWNLAMQVYKNMPKGAGREEILCELKEKGKKLIKKGIYRNKKAKILLWSFLYMPILFQVMIKFI